MNIVDDIYDLVDNATAALEAGNVDAAAVYASLAETLTSLAQVRTPATRMSLERRAHAEATGRVERPGV